MHSFLTEGLAYQYVGNDRNGSLCPVLMPGLAREFRYLSIDGRASSTQRCETTCGGNIGYDAASARQGMEAALEQSAKVFGSGR